MAITQTTYVGKLNIPLVSATGNTTTRTITVEKPRQSDDVQTAFESIVAWIEAHPTFIQPASWRDDTSDDTDTEEREYRYSSTDENPITYDIVETTKTRYYITT